MADTVVIVEPRIHTVEIADAPSVAVVVEERVNVVTVGVQGPDGQQGLPGTALPPINFAFGDASPRVVYTPAQNVLVMDVEVIIDTAFNGASPSLSVSASAATLMPPSLNDLKSIGSYEASPNLRINAGTPFTVTITPGAGATQGAGQLVISLIPI